MNDDGSSSHEGQSGIPGHGTGEDSDRVRVPSGTGSRILGQEASADDGQGLLPLNQTSGRDVSTGSKIFKPKKESDIDLVRQEMLYVDGDGGRRNLPSTQASASGWDVSNGSRISYGPANEFNVDLVCQGNQPRYYEVVDVAGLVDFRRIILVVR